MARIHFQAGIQAATFDALVASPISEPLHAPPSARAFPRVAAIGWACGLASFSIWGLLPIYYRQLKPVPALEVLAYRVLGAALILVFVLVLRGRSGLLWPELRTWRRLRLHAPTAALIGLNWLAFVWAVQNDRLLDASLGYYLNPLVSLLLAVMFLKERIRRGQIAALALAGVSVFALIVRHGHVPWIGLVLSGCFALYGLLRKKADHPAVLGLAIETVLLAPFAFGLILILPSSSLGHVSPTVDVLLLLSGLTTVLPLVLFLEAARRLRLSTVGLMQYLLPTLQFVIAVGVFHEPFSTMHWVTFGGIWAALVLYGVAR
ncbi:MAG: EamA family transporter RarD [Deltaproteobacteria bacterium]|nr:EamA family transporter RarD [Deltaproteobacteria bacterium]